ncbi:Kynurenine 3-monooxygenase [Rhizoctonia solani]|uniref:Kynurenine 3-monooxygenase n=1 Tax=Rhizoctonia solani TaxID=456999 RepID=A0A8H7M8R8_9AGAM|nr:Kynurenine 3-monooxygenase [Rhizoctonia solani]
MRELEAKANLSLRSINLAISSRGISALCVVDPAIAERFMKNVIPMHGRMIHDNLGQCHSQLYDRDGQAINSIDRGLLNIGLLDELSSYQNIRLHFRTKLSTVDFNSRIATFSAGKNPFDVQFDLCIGADGSYSNVRRQMMRVVRMDYQQEYLPHDYIELSIPPGRGTNGKPTFLLDPNHLHIWPRHSFMLIALPNKDRSFTCTLFAPTKDLDTLDTTDKFVAWFEVHFRDALAHIGRDRLVASFERNPRNSLICVKCFKQANPYHYKDRAIIIGDAAHAMTPFYGQGLNCGLEDVRVLMNTLLSFGALAYYSEHRHQDLVAICDLAMGNYVEMRHSVTTPIYRLRKWIDGVLAGFTPSVPWQGLIPALAQTTFPVGAARGWISLYTMVTFRPDISYATAQRKAREQAEMIRSSQNQYAPRCTPLPGYKALRNTLARTKILRSTITMTLKATTRTVVVLGASYAGHRAVQILLQVLPADWKIIVIDRNTHFNHLYAFPRMAVIEGHEYKAFIPYTNIFKILNLEARRLDEPRSSGHQLIHAHVTRIDAHKVYYSPIPTSSAGEQSVDFDYMVYALGSHLPSPINVWADPVPIHGQPESDLPKSNRHGNKPEGTNWLCAAQARLKEANSVLVIGGGALGVQFASDAASLYPRKTLPLFIREPNCFPAMEGLKELGVSVLLSSRVDLNSAEDHDGKRTLKTVDGRRIGAELVLMCTGQRPNTSLLSNVSSSSVDPRTGLVSVLRSLQLGPGSGSTSAQSPLPHIFVIGDAADAFGALNAGHTAWTQRALSLKAEIASRNIGRLITGSGEELERYEAPPHSIKVTLGLDQAIFQSKGQFGKKQGPEECALDLNTPSMWLRRG